MGTEKWQMADGKCRMADGKWRMADAGWQTANVATERAAHKCDERLRDDQRDWYEAERLLLDDPRIVAG